MDQLLRGRRRVAALAAAMLLCGALACNLPFGGQAAPTPALPGSPASSASATLSGLKAVVEATLSSGGAWAAATEGQAVAAGGSVRTGPDARARLDTSDASIVRLAGGTTLGLDTLPGRSAGSDTKLSLGQGQLWALVSDTPNGGAFEIATPAAAVTATRGSFVSVSYFPDNGRVSVTCLDGKCRLAGASGSSTDLVSGQQAEVASAGQNPTGGSPMDGLQLSGWAAEFPEAQPVVSKITPAAPGPGQAPVANITNGRAGTPDGMRLEFDAQGVLHLVWRSNRDRESGDIFHQQLAPGGKWTDPESLTTGFEYLDSGPQLLKGADGHLCVLWTGGPTQSDGGTWGLFQTCQSGAGWSKPERIDPTWGEFSAALAPDGAIKALQYGRLTGVKYNGVVLSSDTVAAVAPRFAIDSAGAYHAAWVNLGSPFTVVHRSSSDGGQNWSPDEVVSTDSSLPSGLELVMVADGLGNVHVVWPGNTIYYRRWSPTTGWGDVEQLGNGGQIVMATDAGGRAWIVWAGGGQTFYQVQGQDGKFGAPVPFGELGSGKPALAVDGQGAAHIVWLQGNDLFYATVSPPPG